MNDRHRLSISIVKLFDIVLVALSFGLAALLIVHVENKMSFAEFLALRTRIGNFLIFALALLICHILLCISGLYMSRRLSRKRAEAADLFKAITLTVACFIAVGWIFSVRMITLPFVVAFWAICLISLCGSRIVIRMLLARIRMQGRNLRYMLVLGTNPRAVDFALRIVADRERGYRLLGFVDDEWAGTEKFRQSEFNLVCDCAGLKDFLRWNVVDEITIFLPFGSFYTHCHNVADLCRQHGIILRFNSDVFNIKGPHQRTEEFDGDQFITTFASAAEGWPALMKRSLDIALSVLLIVVSAPLLIAAAIAIKLTSPGPIIFAQDRVGLNKRKFRIYKLRTMIQNAEKLMAGLEKQNEASGPVFKIRKDPRITPVGRFLRRSSIDELPQLFNVLKGDMSLVGPRPLPLRDYAGFSQDWQRRRFSFKPGLTCLWQINGRSGISFDQWMQLDIQYMDEWSLWLDLKILAKTVPAVLRGAGAA